MTAVRTRRVVAVRCREIVCDVVERLTLPAAAVLVVGVVTADQIDDRRTLRL
jgi:hypothetical protein